jgi:predicted 2-oxoglutarate/Fe(II)-dependent dioxygenase YbiX
MGAPNSSAVVLGSPVPWFRGKTLSGASVDLHVSAGRWIVLSFFGAISDAHAQARLAALAKLATTCSEDHLMIYAVMAAPPADSNALIAATGPVLRFVQDYDDTIGKFYGAHQSARTVVLDPMLRAVANISCENPDEHDAILDRFLLGLPTVDNSAGVSLTAPVLIVPRVFDFSLCDHLIAVFEKIGGTDSGFLMERGGQPTAVTDHSRKSRRDLVIVAPDLRQLIGEQIVTRLLPAIALYLQFKATHMDRYVVSCYDRENGGHFFRHRDNMTAGVEHRRFAVSINLNGDYEGCDLIFPEFGRRTYRAPTGGAIVFSCGVLHQVLPITSGKRYAFLPFLYGEGDVSKSMENDALLQEIGVDYRADEHRLLAS